MAEPAYDSTADTLKHSLRVGTLMGQPIAELVQRSTRHDLSKTEPPELVTVVPMTLLYRFAVRDLRGRP